MSPMSIQRPQSLHRSMLEQKNRIKIFCSKIPISKYSFTCLLCCSEPQPHAQPPYQYHNLQNHNSNCKSTIHPKFSCKPTNSPELSLQLQSIKKIFKKNKQNLTETKKNKFNLQAKTAITQFSYTSIS